MDSSAEWIVGAGGGGDSKEPTRTADSLLSQDYFEIVLGISEGPIKGHVYSTHVLENFYADDTPAISAATGEANFSDFAAVLYKGEDDDPAFDLKLGGTSANVPVGVQLSSAVAVTRTTPSVQRNNFNQLEVRIHFDYLAKTNNAGNFESTALLRIQYKRSSSSTWLDYENTPSISIKGKTTSGYARDFIIPVATVNEDYDVRVTKLSPDHVQGVDEDVANMTWESFQVVKLGNVRFPHLACMHIHGKASNQFTSLPEFSGVFDGLIVRVPTNYNPATRVYDESTPWDGQFKFAYTNNGVWILYELLTNARYGMARYYKSVTANRYEFYTEAKWCDEMVPDGRGGYQPRFTFNEWLSEPKDGQEFLRYVAGSFNGVLDDDGAGVIVLRTDRPRAAKQVFSPETVTPAGFSYTFSDISTRYNEIKVAFANPDMGWETDWRTATIDNTNDIAANGRIPFEFVAVGCTDPWEAVRRANYRYVTANQEVETVSFTTTRAGLLARLLDTVYVADPDADWGETGRVKSATAATIQLRDPIYFPDTSPRQAKVQTYSGLVTLTVVPVSVGDNYSLTVSGSNFPVGNVPANTQFVIEDAGDLGFAKPFRVLGIEEVDGRPDEVTITAIEVAVGKYEQVETSTGYVPTQYSYTTPGEAFLPDTMELTSPPPAISKDGTLSYSIEVAWGRVPEANASRFEIDFKPEGESSWRTVTAYGDRAFLEPVAEGKTYTVRLYAVSPIGSRTQRCLQDTIQVASKTSTLPDVSGLTAVRTTTGWEVRWTNPTNIPDLEGLDIRIGNASSTDFFALPAKYLTKSSPQAMPWLPAGTNRIMARFKDSSGNRSAHTATYDLVVSAPATPVLTLQRTIDATYVMFQDMTTDQPLKHVEVRTGDGSSTFATAADRGTYAANQRTITVIPNAASNTKVYVRAVDEAGNAGNVATDTIPAAAGSVAKLIDMAVSGVTLNNMAADAIGKINLIDADASVAGSVNQRLQTVMSQSTGGSFTGLLGFNMNGTLHGFSGFGVYYGSLVAGNYTATLMCASNGYGIIHKALPAEEQFSGAKADKVRMRVRRIGTPAWYGVLYYGVLSGHGYTDSYRAIAPQPAWDATTGWANVEWDMTALVAGGTDWTTSIIERIRFDLGYPSVDNGSDGFEIDFISVGSYGGSDTYSLVQQESTARQDADGFLGAQWALRVAMVNGNSTAAVGGIAVSGTNAGNAGARFDIAFRSNTVTFLPPSGQSDTTYSPFVYYSVATVVNGVSIPAGLYLKSAFIDYISAVQIDTRGMEIKSAAGAVIFSSGVNLDSSRVNAAANWLNGNIAVQSNGTITGIGTGDGQSVANNRDSVITAPGGGLLVTQNPSMTGSIKIRLPVWFTDTMVRFTVEIYEYITGFMCTIELGGYNYNTETRWHSVSAKVLGGSNVEYPVFFGHDGTKCCVWIDVPTANWTYPQVRVRDVFLGFNNVARDTWATGWQVSVDTAFTNVSGTGANQYTANVTDTLPGADWSKTARRPANVAALSGSESINNANVSISSSGALTGAGGGQVTIAGLGYTGDLNASADLTLVNDNGTVVTGNRILKTYGVTGWNASARSKESFAGGAFVSASPESKTMHVMFGLNQDPSLDNNWDGIDLGWYCQGSGNACPIASGVIYNTGGNLVAYNPGDTFTVTYDGVTAKWFQNGALVMSMAYTSTTNLYFDSSLYETGSALKNCRLGPLTSALWSGVGGAGKPQDNATVGASWNSNISGQPSDSTIQNSQININASGQLVGIGAGNATTVSNNQIYLSGDNIYGIGSGSGTQVANSALVPSINSAATTATWTGVTGTGKPADNATVGASWNSNISGQPADSTIQNNQIGINASGQFYGGGAGVGTVVSNNQMSIGSDGKLYSAGTYLGSQVTFSGLGGGAMGLLNQLTSLNVSTYIASAAIDYTRIGVLQAQNLSVLALSNTVNGGVTGVGRVEITSNRIDVYDDSNVRRVRLGLL